jgi:hypothetical protein
MRNEEAYPMIVEFHSIIGMVWDIWKGIAIGSHLVIVPQQLEHHKRRTIRLFVGIAGTRE